VAAGEKQWVACAMSGGVDSSVAAALLLRRGYQVVGITMRVWPDVAVAAERACCSIAAVDDARAVAARLGIPHVVVDLREEFRRTVIADFISEYRAGRTPNPCIVCNRVVKFEVLLEKARAYGAELLATGHYARIARHDATGRWCVRRGVDAGKDQSYALYGLTQAQLARTLLPLGELTKSETRALAHELGLRTAAKPDSQEICFIPDDDYAAFLRTEAPELAQPGPMVDCAGVVRGTHQGVAFYTIGQRHGLGLGGGRAPWYVIALNAATNTVVVGPAEALRETVVRADDVIYGALGPDDLRTPQPVTAMVRYRMPAQPATAVRDGDRLFLTFATPQRAVTPGQALVCYTGEDVAVGGTIVKAGA
jgi:tRNA-uridine 2-sulfurtransferase